MSPFSLLDCSSGLEGVKRGRGEEEEEIGRVRGLFAVVVCAGKPGCLQEAINIAQNRAPRENVNNLYTANANSNGDQYGTSTVCMHGKITKIQCIL